MRSTGVWLTYATHKNVAGNNRASDSSPTLGCSIEILRDIYVLYISESTVVLSM